jgi:hypothetical protein
VLKLLAVSAFGAFVVSGPLQHVGVLPKSAIGDASKSAIKMVLNRTVEPAFARCGGGGGNSGGFKGNNGFGNGGFDGVPGRSADNNAPSAGQKRADVVR